MIPTTAARVRENTCPEINRRIQRETDENVIRVAAKGPTAINQRLSELDQEWDIERTLETNASIAVLVGSTLGLTVNKRFFAVPAVIAGFLLQHAVQGWCPPLPILRRLGFRTESEINDERYALKALRGDFNREGLTGQSSAQEALEMLAAARQ